MLNKFVFFFCRFISAVLLFAALLKSLSIFFNELPFWNQLTSLDNATTVGLLVWVSFECVCAAKLYLNPTSISSLYVGLALFTVMSAVSGVRVYFGEEYCSCFGNVRVLTPWIFGFDTLVAATFAMLIVSNRKQAIDQAENDYKLTYLASAFVPLCVIGVASAIFKLGLASQFGLSPIGIHHTLEVAVMPGKVDADSHLLLSSFSPRRIVLHDVGPRCAIYSEEKLPISIESNSNLRIPVNLNSKLCTEGGRIHLLLIIDDGESSRVVRQKLRIRRVVL